MGPKLLPLVWCKNIHTGPAYPRRVYGRKKTSWERAAGSLERWCQLRRRSRHLTEVQNYEIHLEKHPDQQVLYKKNIGSGEDDKMIQRWNAFDPSHENIYFLVGNKVVKFPIGSCSLYEDCHSCLSATEDDPLGCGWCGDHCSHQQECETPDKFSTNSCSPLIYKVSPTSGPTEGGTLLTIWGDNFGSAHSGELQSNISISVAGMPCHIFLWKKDR
ncbi:hypothetical protein AVEN_205018-1 [Araneus ventricosus]|uniref:PSI domain-containing protein n=1 Tax=Araneus ventricosus TaxID=182803 RepID=A0A4Y2UZR2_ARAVE|nr:hypothetical protein AVEN_204156-1 [Araneus ventricosus]GBO17143.1 hypothetical protein AVEN_205018-1 [Araneus ventricosus]